MVMPTATGTTATPDAYEPRHAEDALLYRVVAAGLETFLISARDRGHALPAFVENTFREFLTCSVPTHGLVRVHCDRCGDDRVVYRLRDRWHDGTSHLVFEPQKLLARQVPVS